MQQWLCPPSLSLLCEQRQHSCHFVALGVELGGEGKPVHPLDGHICTLLQQQERHFCRANHAAELKGALPQLIFGLQACWALGQQSSSKCDVIIYCSIVAEV